MRVWTILVLRVTGRNENGGMPVAGNGGRDVQCQVPCQSPLRGIRHRRRGHLRHLFSPSWEMP